MDQPWHKPPKQRILPLPQPSNNSNNNHNPATHGLIPPPPPSSLPAASTSPTSSYSGLDWQNIMQLYQNQPDLLKMILNSKVEEDKRRTEEAKLRSKELDLYIQDTKKRIAAYHQQQYLHDGNNSNSSNSRRESTSAAAYLLSASTPQEGTPSMPTQNSAHPVLSYYSHHVHQHQQLHPRNPPCSTPPVCSSASASASTYIHHHSNASHQK